MALWRIVVKNSGNAACKDKRQRLEKGMFIVRGRFFDPKATLRAEDRRRNLGELMWMELTVKQKNNKYRGIQKTVLLLLFLSVTRIQLQTSLVYNNQRH